MFAEELRQYFSGHYVSHFSYNNKAVSVLWIHRIRSLKLYIFCIEALNFLLSDCGRNLQKMSVFGSVNLFSTMVGC